MTNLEWQQLAETVSRMTAVERERLLALVAQQPAPGGAKRILGLMAEDTDLLDEVVAGAFSARERQPLRVPADE
jgi:hypothetical protein